MRRIDFVPILAFLTLAVLVAAPVSAADPIADATITARISTAFLFNEHLNPFEIDTRTEDGTVYIEGFVETPIQRDLAERVAKSVEGVKQVVNNIQVGGGEAARREGSNWASTVTEESTAASVRTRLQNLKDLGADAIEVQVQGNTVILTGVVATPEERERAGEVARTTRGVRRVDNRLEVREQPSPDGGADASPPDRPRGGGVRVGPGREPAQPQEPPQPRRVTPRGSQLLTREAEGLPPHSTHLRAQAVDDEAALLADADIPHVSRAGSDRAAEVGGDPPQRVVRPEDPLYMPPTAQRIDAPEPPGDPIVTESMRPSGTQEGRGDADRGPQTAASDEWLEKRIELDLLLSNRVSVWDLEVEVEDGVATLAGTVDSDGQRQEAERIAFSIDGVQAVRNQIGVATAAQ